MSDERLENVIIIGSGPAGYTAAIYAARANLEPLMISGNSEGGQLMITTEVDNFPGFPEGINGPGLMHNMKQQALRFGTNIVGENVNRINFKEKPFTVHTDFGKEFKTKTIIIATGAKARLLGIPSEAKFMGHGVSACATCDGFFFRGKDVIIVGGGDSALEEAMFLTKFAKSVSVVHRRDELRASKIMRDRAGKNPKINFVWNSEVKEILGEEGQDGGVGKKVTGVLLFNNKTKENVEMPIDGVFVAIGHTPQTEIFAKDIEMDEKKYIVTKSNTMTNVEGVFACGDVADSYYRQAITAAGSGCQAAIDVERYLENL